MCKNKIKILTTLRRCDIVVVPTVIENLETPDNYKMVVSGPEKLKINKSL